MNTRPGLVASVLRISNSTKVRSTLAPPTRTARLAGSSSSSRTRSGTSSSSDSLRAMPARRSAARTRERNSRSEKGLVM